MICIWIQLHYLYGGKNGYEGTNGFWLLWILNDDTRKRALLLYAAGDEVEKIFEMLSDVGEDKDYKKAVEKLNEYFSPKKNVLFETHKFRQLKQLTEETIDQYCTRLQQQAMICEFSSIKNEIKIQLVEGCLSSRVRRKAIQDDLSLANILAYARSLEITDKGVKTLEEDFTHLASTSSAVNSIYNPQGKHRNQYSRNSWNSYPPKMRDKKNHGNSNTMVRNYVITVVTSTRQVISVSVEREANLVLHVANKIISQLCVVVVKIPETIFQSRAERTFSL